MACWSGCRTPPGFPCTSLPSRNAAPAAFAAKSRKDISQAAAVLEVLNDLRPGDVIAAGEAARLQGERFVNQISRRCKAA